MKSIAITSLLLVLAGCASYATPGRPADLQAVAGVTPEIRQAQTEPDIERLLQRKPLASFPTGIVFARVQAPDYQSRTASGWGDGRYSIVFTRDIEKPDQLARLEKMPMVSGVAPINKLLLNPHLQSDDALRQAAAKLHADMLLIYTLDTSFTDIDKAVGLSVITLGIAPNRNIRVTTTASAILMDTRNGYIYGLSEATANHERNTSAWQSTEAIDQSRLETESQAFEKLVGELEKTWPRIVKQYASTSQAVGG